MGSLHEKLRNINRKISKADAVVRNLQAAEKDYSEGYYTNCSDAAFKVKKLDPDNPEAKTLENLAIQRKQCEISQGNELRSGYPAKEKKTIVFEVSAPASGYRPYTANTNYKIPSDNCLNWLVSAIIALVIVAMVYYLITAFVIHAFAWIDGLIAAGAENTWSALNVVAGLFADTLTVNMGVENG